MRYHGNIDIEIFGASHAEQIGVTLGGIPAGLPLSVSQLQQFTRRRRSGGFIGATPRQEADEIIIKSGIESGFTNGHPITAVINNTCRQSADYAPYANTPRPSHADYTAIVKDGAAVDLRGGGRFSGRMTAPLCIAGGIALQLLEAKGIEVAAYVSSVGTVNAVSYKDRAISLAEIRTAQRNFPVLGDKQEEVRNEIALAAQLGDSVGGSIECIVYGVTAGLGDALFLGLEGTIATFLYAIPAVKGVEFGWGFDLCSMRGSAANDAFQYQNGRVVTVTNHGGGINGGISNGMEILTRVAVKPTPSIALPQRTVDLSTHTNTVISIKGRHDACIVPRAVAPVEAAVALALLDALYENN